MATAMEWARLRAQAASELEVAAAALCAVVTVCHVLVRLLPLEAVVFLAPGDALIEPWQFVTANIFEDSTPNLLLMVWLLYLTSTRLHNSWGAHEAVRFVSVVAVLQTTATWITMVALYILFRHEHFLFARLGGCTGLIGGLSVVLKQQATRGGTMHAAETANAAERAADFVMEHGPLLQLVWSGAVLALSHSGPPDELLFAWYGILAGWTYLRYYQAATGDCREAFAFAELFPPPLSAGLRPIGLACFGAFSSCCCGFFPPPAHAAIASQPDSRPGVLYSALGLSEIVVEAPPPVTTQDPELAERRRQRARDLLEQRLAHKLATAGDATTSVAASLPSQAPTTAPASVAAPSAA